MVKWWYSNPERGGVGGWRGVGGGGEELEEGERSWRDEEVDYD